MYNILLCDDEPDIVRALKIYLNNPDYCFYEAGNGLQAVETVRNHDIHLVLMDIMMPVMDGIAAIEEIRKYSNVPVILLTAKSEDTDKILGLNTGADDYITKPFHPMEVTARVRSALRRYMTLGGRTLEPSTYVIGGIELDDRQKQVTLDGEEVSLTPTEYEILKLLMQNPGKVFDPKDLYRAVWKQAPLGRDNTVAVHVRHLREKIEIDPAEPRYLKVVWGRGYKMEAGGGTP